MVITGSERRKRCKECMCVTCVQGRERERERERERAKKLETGLSDSLKSAVGSVGQCAGVDAAGLHSVHNTVCRHQLHTVYAAAWCTLTIQ